MRSTPLALAMLLAFAGGDGLARSDAPEVGQKAQSRAIYLVDFVEPPLASFRGVDRNAQTKLAGLKATSPAVTGQRKLNVSSADSIAYRAALAQLRQERLASAGAKFGRTLEPLFVYDVVSNGVALELTPEEAATLVKSDGVLRVEPDFLRHADTDAGPQWINADALWNGEVGTATQGEGVVVGVIDSGINRTHPSFAAIGPLDGHRHTNPRGNALGLCTTTPGNCNAKLIGIHDFSICTGVHSSSDCNDREANDGLDVTGHGTHVASTAVGNALNMSLSLPTGAATRRISGVAPHANVIAYKACEDEETCRGTWLKAALDQAVADGVDVINYSIGGDPRSPWNSSDSLAMLSAREAGVVVVVAAGNDGPLPGSAHSPGDSPWVIGAANATHDRGIVNRLVDLSGGATAPPSGGILVGVGNTGGYGPRPLIVDPQFPLCSIGTDLDANQSGISNPWPIGRFNGEILVCERGVQARVAKSANVRFAGGGGMVLVNTAAEGESIISDSHSIPSTHLGFTAGSALKAWLASGSGHQGRLEGAAIQNVPELGDLLSSSSGRGPVEVAPGTLKPDLTAPGSSILAAAVTGSGSAFMSGTSMATPHIAGAAALLVGARPNWTPSQVESALLTTARPSVRNHDGVNIATPFQQGAGATDVGKALTAGLFFDVTAAEFRNANPSNSGVPRALNRPSLVHESCFETCTLTRRVTDMVGGADWRVEVSLASGATATATPSTFSLTSGQSATINFSFDVRDGRLPGTWVDGRVKFIRTGGAAAANAEIPLTLFADPGTLPDAVGLSGSGESGFQDMPLSGLVALPQAQFETTELVAPVVTEQSLVQDPTRNDRYDSFGVGTTFTTVQIPAAGSAGTLYKLLAKTSSATAYDVDLFVGEDLDNDGSPDESEELCSSTGPRDAESCELDITAGRSERRYWVLFQNWDAGAQGDGDVAGTSDVIALETAKIAIDGPRNDAFGVTGPGHTASGEAFKLRLSWDDPTLLLGERRFGYLKLGATGSRPSQVGLVPVELTRVGPSDHAAAVLSPNGTRRMRLAAGAAQEKLYVDVPPNAGGLTVSTSGTGEVDLYLAKVDTPSTPTIAPAPARGQAQGTSIHPGASETVTLTGANLSPGRWYVTPVNTGNAAATFDLSVALSMPSDARPTQKFGPYYNPARSGAGIFLYPANNGATWAVIWYTYLQDGTPTWYLGAGNAPAPNERTWRLSMDRYSWDGAAALGKNVGEVQLSLLNPQQLTMSWNLDGESGSETLTYLDGGACPQLNGATAALTGAWYSPTLSGFGYSVNAYPAIEFIPMYLYDGQGIARWVAGTAEPFNAPNITLQQRDGFCPLCAFRTPTTLDVGTMTRRYDSTTAGNAAATVNFKPPLAGTWVVDRPIVRLTDALVCP